MALSEIFYNLGCLTIAFSKVAWLGELGSLLVGCGMRILYYVTGYSSAAESGIMEELDLTLVASLLGIVILGVWWLCYMRSVMQICSCTIEQANVVAQLRKEHTDSMVAHNRRVDLEVENMKRELRAEIMSALKMAADGGIVEPKRVDVTKVCVNRIEQGTGLEIQVSGEVEDEGIVVLQNNGTDDEIGYRPCMVNVTGFSK